MKRYVVTLTAEERWALQALIAAGKASARKLTHARILLKADRDPEGPGWNDEEISEIPAWGPNRLRHNAATSLREQFGIEASRVILGHTSPAMTEVYAEIDCSKATAIMTQVW